MLSNVKKRVFAFCFTRAYTTCFVDRCCGWNIGPCSKRHDKRYENTRLTRLQADILYFRCVKRQVGKAWSPIFAVALASIMFIVLRALGWIRYGTLNNKKTLESITV